MPIWRALRVAAAVSAAFVCVGALRAAAPTDRLVTVLVTFDIPTRWDAFQASGTMWRQPASGHEKGAGQQSAADLQSGAEQRSHADQQSAAARRAVDQTGAAILRLAAPVESAAFQSGGQVVARYDTALAGLLVRVPLSTVAGLRSLPGVRRVAPAPLAKLDLLDSVPGVRADLVRRDLGVDGASVNIAVVDTGVDYTHEALGGTGEEAAYQAATAAAERIDDLWDGRPLYPNAVVIGGYDFAGPKYSPDCTPPLEAQGACTATPRPDPDPLDAYGHGTAVASVAAGRGVGAVGVGVAPGAGVVALKIFGNSDLTDLLIDPIEWAIEANMGEGSRPHVDVLNLSLGQVYGSGLLDEEGPIRRAVAAGIVVVGSAGNWGDLPLVASAPASAPEALAVASHAPPGRHAWTAQLDVGDSAPLQFDSRALYLQGWSPDPRQALSAPVVHVGRACPAGGSVGAADPLLADPAGAVALFDMAWGSAGPDCTVDRQARRLQDEGAVAALMGAGIGLSVAAAWNAAPTVDIPVWMVNGQLETALDELAPSGSARLQLDPKPLPDANGVVSAFSSRGPGRGGILKPDLSAPGESIFSAAMGQGTRGVSLSGTSLSAPHAAGVAALVWSSARKRGWQLTAADVAALLVTNANPAGVRTSSARPDAPPITRSGAGALDAWAAATAQTVVRAGPLASLSLGALALDAPTELERPITITNHSDVRREYRLSAQLRSVLDAGHGLSVSLEPDSTALEPGASSTVRALFRLEPAELAPWPLGGGQQVGNGDALTDAELDGWVLVEDVTPQVVTSTSRVPFQLLPRAASAVRAGWAPEGDRPGAVQLDNASPFAGAAQIYELGATDPEEPDLPGPADLDAVGARAMADPDGSGNTVLEFALHTRGAYDHPLETASKVELDTDLDGSTDYVAYTVDEAYMAAGQDRNGRVKVALEPPGGSPFGSPTARFYAGSDLFSRALSLPLWAEDTGLTPSRLVVRYRVTRQWLVDRTDEGAPTDRVPSDGSWITFDARGRLPWPVASGPDVAGEGGAKIDVVAPDGTVPDLLVLYPGNPPGAGDAAVLAVAANASAYLPSARRGP